MVRDSAVHLGAVAEAHDASARVGGASGREYSCRNAEAAEKENGVFSVFSVFLLWGVLGLGRKKP